MLEAENCRWNRVKAKVRPPPGTRESTPLPGARGSRGTKFASIFFEIYSRITVTIVLVDRITEKLGEGAGLGLAKAIIGLLLY